MLFLKYIIFLVFKKIVFQNLILLPESACSSAKMYNLLKNMVKGFLRTILFELLNRTIQ